MVICAYDTEIRVSMLNARTRARSIQSYAVPVGSFVQQWRRLRRVRGAKLPWDPRL